MTVGGRDFTSPCQLILERKIHIYIDNYNSALSYIHLIMEAIKFVSVNTIIWISCTEFVPVMNSTQAQT